MASNSDASKSTAALHWKPNEEMPDRRRAHATRTLYSEEEEEEAARRSDHFKVAPDSPLSSVAPSPQKLSRLLAPDRERHRAKRLGSEGWVGGSSVLRSFQRQLGLIVVVVPPSSAVRGYQQPVYMTVHWSP